MSAAQALGAGSPKLAKQPSPLVHLEAFMKPNFSPLEYTREAIVEGGLSLEGSLSSLRQSREMLDQAISSTVAQNEDSLLGTLESVGALKREMQAVRTDAASLDVSSNRVARDIREPLDRLKHSLRRLKNVHEASHLLRKVGWFLAARKKLRVALAGKEEGARELSKAAQLVGEIEELLQGGDLAGIRVVDDDVQWLRGVSQRIRVDAGKALEKAVVSLNQGEVGYALQTFHNLGLLPERVETITAWAAQEFQQEAHQALDVQMVADDAAKRMGEEPVTRATKPSGAAMAEQWRVSLRARCDAMLERSLRSWALRAWNLQRVLHKKRDPATHELFVDVVRAAGGKEAFELFWSRACGHLEAEIRSAARWVKDAMTDDYPRLRRSARAMLQRLWQSSSGKQQAVGGQKEVPVLMQALHPLLADYMARCLRRLSEPVHIMFPDEVKGQRKAPLPTQQDVTTLAGIALREIANVKGDVELMQAVVKACVVAMALFCERAGAQLNVTEQARTFRLQPPDVHFSTSNASAVPLASTARTAAQEHNVAVLYLVLQLLAKLEGEDVGDEVDPVFEAAQAPNSDDDRSDAEGNSESDASSQSEGEDQAVFGGGDEQQSAAPTAAAHVASQRTTRPSLDAARQQLSETALSILRDYLGDAAFKAVDSVLAGVNAENFNIAEMPAAASPFCARVSKALYILETEHLAKLNTVSSPLITQAIHALGARVGRMFSLRVACVRPLSEAGRALLVLNVSVVQEALIKAFPTCKLDGLRPLVARAQTPLELVQSGAVSKCVAWHHMFATLPKDVHSPHTKRDMTLASYLADLEASKDESAKAWTTIESCLVGNRAQFEAFFQIKECRV